MREHLSISLRSKGRIAVAHEFVFECLIIFNYSVVHEREFAACIEVRMSIFVVHFTVRGPTRVADAQ